MGCSSVQTQRKRNIDFYDRELLNNTEDPTPLFMSTDSQSQSADITCSDPYSKITQHLFNSQIISVDMVTANCASSPESCEKSTDGLAHGNKCCKAPLPDSKQSETSPLREIQVACLTQPSSGYLKSPEKHLDTNVGGQSINFSQSDSGCVKEFVSSNVSRMFSMHSASSSFELTSSISSGASHKPGMLKARITNDIIDERHSPLGAGFPNVSANQMINKTDVIDYSSCESGCTKAQNLLPGTCMLYTNDNFKTEPSCDTGNFEQSVKCNLETLGHKKEVTVQDSSSDNFDYVGNGRLPKNKFEMHIFKKKIEKTKHEKDEFHMFHLPSDVFASVETESKVEEILSVNCKSNSVDFNQKENRREQDIDFDNEGTCFSEITFPSSVVNSNSPTPLVQADLNVRKDSCTLSFTEDSQSLYFTEHVDWRESEVENSNPSPILDQIQGDAVIRLRVLKAQHMAEMGTLTFTQTQSFPA